MAWTSLQSSCSGPTQQQHGINLAAFVSKLEVKHCAPGSRREPSADPKQLVCCYNWDHVHNRLTPVHCLRLANEQQRIDLPFVNGLQACGRCDAMQCSLQSTGQG